MDEQGRDNCDVHCELGREQDAVAPRVEVSVKDNPPMFFKLLTKEQCNLWERRAEPEMLDLVEEFLERRDLKWLDFLEGELGMNLMNIKKFIRNEIDYKCKRAYEKHTEKNLETIQKLQKSICWDGPAKQLKETRQKLVDELTALDESLIQLEKPLNQILFHALMSLPREGIRKRIKNWACEREADSIGTVANLVERQLESNGQQSRYYDDKSEVNQTQTEFENRRAAPGASEEPPNERSTSSSTLNN